MSDSKERDTVEQGQKQAAESLRRQIQDLAEGKAPAQRPSNLRDFVERKMVEDKIKEADESDKKK